MTPKKHKGLFVTFEGGDGAGKTTLMEAVFSHLSAKAPVLKTRAPGGTPLGQKIRSLILEKQEASLEKLTELFLFLADRSEHVQKVILPALEQEKILLCDRFSDSTIAYQAGARGLPESQVRSLCDLAAYLVKPDLTFYLDIDPSLGLSRALKSRGSHDLIEQETLTFHEKIRSVFLKLAKEEPSRIIVLDATLPKEVLAHQAITRLEKSLCSVI